MGISLDTDPDWPVWVVLDTLFAVVFVVEVVVKSYAPGRKTPIRGPKT